MHTDTAATRPLSLRGHQRLQFLLRQTALVVAAVAVYFAVRHLTEGGVEAATTNAQSIIDLQARMGIGVERDVQAWVLAVPWMSTVMNWIYIWGHWPVIAAVLGWLAWKTCDGFLLYRNTLIISGLVGMTIAATYPMAPPRLLDLGILDTITMESTSYRVLQPPGLTNQYAAMPSFHFGWNLVIGIALAREASTCWMRAIGWCLPVAMGFAIVITGNHFILDAIAGCSDRPDRPRPRDPAPACVADEDRPGALRCLSTPAHCSPSY